MKSNVSVLRTLNKDEEGQSEEQADGREDELVEKKPDERLAEEMRVKEALSRKEREEAQQEGSVSWRLYFEYFYSGGGFLGTLFIVLMFLAAQAMMVMCCFGVLNRRL